ncbi:MAG: SDR family NAD(P)-dependent oxidoreductase [Gammaproteobacteria bacterium]|jgi:meso-butanediol dehydrogenase/(S,S)-butanediol dehydrogenase/diacetyl reductase|nr:glucose 1-dehydrogenase [Gammaproteobacteria bacterium]
MGSLAGKVAVVTGGGQGIGLGISQAMLAAGAQVLVAQRSPLPETLAGANWVETDLSQPDSYATIAAAAEAQHAGIDILVNNAGFMFEKTIDEMQLDDWNRMLAVNLTAPLFLSKALLPLLRHNGGGSIVHIGSIEGLAANPEHAAYCASKGGVHALTRAMAVDLGKDGIRVNAIAPGWIRSALSDDYINAQQNPDAAWQGLYQMHPSGRIGEPADVGKLAVYLAGDDSEFITGQVIVIDGGRTSKLPLPF